LERSHDLEHGEIVDEGRPTRVAPPRRRFIRGAALEERISIGIEEAAPIGLNPQKLVVHSAVNGSSRGEDAVPGG
jgi:hypothetical protein